MIFLVIVILIILILLIVLIIPIILILLLFFAFGVQVQCLFSFFVATGRPSLAAAAAHFFRQVLDLEVPGPPSLGRRQGKSKQETERDREGRGRCDLAAGL